MDEAIELECGKLLDDIEVDGRWTTSCGTTIFDGKAPLLLLPLALPCSCCCE